MTEIAISYGSYYSYLRKNRNKRDKALNIEACVQIFNDEEVCVDFPESIRGKHIFIFGDCVHYFMELLMTVDAARRASASEITVVLPYYGYCRQDKKGVGRISLGASVIANQLENIGVNRIIAIDLHSDQIQLAFKIPFEHISGKHLFENEIREILDNAKELNKNVLLVSPDAGGTDRVKQYAKMFGLNYVVMDKEREQAGKVKSMRLIGDPAELKDAILVQIDDIVDTGGTLILGNETLKKYEPFDIINILTHPVMSKNAYQKLTDSGMKLITSNTRNSVVGKKNPNFTIVDCNEIIMQAITNISLNKSILTTLTA